MRPHAWAAAGLMLTAAAWVASRAGDEGEDDLVMSIKESAADAARVVVGAVSGWSPALEPERYRAMIAAASSQYGLPAGMLSRLLWQESRYRAAAVNRASGAQGIAQFMPATAAWMGVDAMDPASAIPGAARYLRNLYGQFQDWSMALAAYNWGPGNVKRKGMGAMPKETRLYVAGIMGDLGMSA